MLTLNGEAITADMIQRTESYIETLNAQRWPLDPSGPDRHPSICPTDFVLHTHYLKDNRVLTTAGDSTEARFVGYW